MMNTTAKRTPIINIECFVLYEAEPATNVTNFGSQKLNTNEVLKNGRTGYIPFEKAVAALTGLLRNSQGGKPDLISFDGVCYEVKAFKDFDVYPGKSADLFHTAASRTFGGNTFSKVIKALLNAGNYAAALAICIETGFAKNDFYIYTNTAQYTEGCPFKFIIVPKAWVLANLDPTDPRRISRDALLAAVTRTQLVCFK